MAIRQVINSIVMTIAQRRNLIKSHRTNDDGEPRTGKVNRNYGILWMVLDGWDSDGGGRRGIDNEGVW